MSFEAQKNSAKLRSPLGGCLVEGDPEQQKRERRIRRRALAISISLQSLFVAAVVIVPILMRPDRIVMAHDFVPIPPYSHHAASHAQPPANPHQNHFRTCIVCPTVAVLQHAPTSDPTPPTLDSAPNGLPEGDGPDRSGFLPLNDGRSQPERPRDVQPTHPQRISTQLDPAMLIHRVEPRYPILGLQTHRPGHVELRAIIATDGSIQSLQLVRGDPLFVQSAMDAVRQWRYRPTYLNGQAVEIDTYITVDYTLQN